MSSRAWARPLARVLALGLAVLLGWLVWSQIHQSWAALSGFRLRLSWLELSAALLFGLTAFLLETRAWQRAINGSVGREEMGIADSVSMVNASGLLKYLPGRIWSYGAQVMWLAKRGIAGAPVVYVNIVCIFCSMVVSSLVGGAYLIHYLAPATGAWALFLLLLTVHVLGLLFGPRLMASALGPIRRLTGREIVITPVAPALMAELGGLYVLTWGCMGAAGYYSGRGVGLAVTSADVMAITASMSVSWVIGYVSAVTPGGMGVREGLMYLILSKVGSAETAVILPIVTRLLYLSIEILLGGVGVMIGLRRGLFRRVP
jgi:hypothetical protein